MARSRIIKLGMVIKSRHILLQKRNLKPTSIVYLWNLHGVSPLFMLSASQGGYKEGDVLIHIPSTPA